MRWEEIRDQDLAVKMMRSHWNQNRLSRAYLFAGPAGVGKRSLAGILAAAVNCTGGDSAPCGECKSCVQLAKSAHPDWHHLEPEGASEQIKIAEVRRLLGRIALRPFYGKMHVVLIDRADRLTEEAANSLLKALEEPSEKTLYILTAIEWQRCLPTILSRCQVLHFRCLRPATIERLLIEREICGEEEARAVSLMSEGSFSKAMHLAKSGDGADDLTAHCRHTISDWLEQPLPDSRQKVAPWIEAMLLWLRDVIVADVAGESAPANHKHRGAILRQAREWNRDRCMQTAFKLMELKDSLDRYANAKLVASLAREQWLNLFSSQTAGSSTAPTGNH